MFLNVNYNGLLNLFFALLNCVGIMPYLIAFYATLLDKIEPSDNTVKSTLNLNVIYEVVLSKFSHLFTYIFSCMYYIYLET